MDVRSYLDPETGEVVWAATWEDSPVVGYGQSEDEAIDDWQRKVDACRAVEQFNADFPEVVAWKNQMIGERDAQ